MEKSLIDNLIYVSIKKIALASNKSQRTIRRYCLSGKYQYRLIKGNGGQQYEILFTSLEPEVQAKLRGNISAPQLDDSADTVKLNSIGGLPSKHLKSRPLSFEAPNQITYPKYLNTGGEKPEEVNFEVIKNALISFGLDKIEKDERVIPESARLKALAKIDLILHWQDFRNSNKNKKEADKKFVQLYNTKLYSEPLYDRLGKTSIQTLYRWYKEWSENNKDWRVLIDSYHYGSESKLVTSLSDTEKFLLLKYMLNQNKFALGRAYEHIATELKRYGVQNISSLSAYRRVWAYVCKNHSESVEYARGGLKSALDKKLPHLIRDNTLVKVGDVIVGDGHVLDFMVKNPESGKPCRAILVGFIDLASRDLIGFDIMLTENTQVIASALRNSIIYLGKIPAVVQLDNGRAFKGKTFTGALDFSSAGIQGLYSKLGIETVFTKPYNGREKVIERFFEELTESCAKMMPSYIGNNIANKPAYMHRNEKFHASIKGNFVPTIEEAKIIIEQWLNEVYRKRLALNDKTKTIKEFVDEGRGIGVNIDDLDDLMMSSKPRRIGRNGINLFGEMYYAPELTGLDIKIIAKYSMFDLSYVKVYSTRGELICRAERIEKVHPFAELLGSPKDLAQYRHQQKQLQKIVKDKLDDTKKVLKGIYKDNYCKTVVNREVKSIETVEDKYTINCEDHFVHSDKIYDIDYSDATLVEEKKYNVY